MSHSIPQFTVYNTLSRSKEIFEPHKAGEVSIYICGMTVYDLCHIGHARSMCSFDTNIRYLESVGYKVRMIRNITDIDDKIINRANELGKSASDLSEECIKHMHSDFAALGLRKPDAEPKATEFIAQIIELIERLVDKGFAYSTEEGDVYYRVRKFKKYGQLSGKKIDDLLAGVRIEPNSAKEDTLDFALWKAAKPGEPSWKSPWGNGRPGWHIECSAMSMNELGHDFDIHGGGPDLVFPHHENEIAQSCAAYDCGYAHYWMHAGPLRVGEDKMSKSLGNFITIRDALAQYSPEVLRYYFAACHYRSSIEYSPEHLEQSARTVEKLYLRLRGCRLDESILTNHPAVKKFHIAMCDDFATPDALAALQALASDMARADDKTKNQLASTLYQLANSLGLLQQSPEEFLSKSNDENISEQQITEAIENRNIARKEKDFAAADTIRQQLESQGVLLEDTAQGTIWRRAR